MMLKNFKIFLIMISLLVLNNCGYQPVLINYKEISFKKIELSGDRQSVFELEKKINVKTDTSSPAGLTLKGQIFESSDISLTDNRGLATEENYILNFTFQIFDQNQNLILSDMVSKSRRIKISDNNISNIQIRNNEKKSLIESIAQDVNTKLRINLKN